MKKLFKRGVALLCSLAFVMGAAAPAFAYTPIDLTQKTSLTLVYGEEEPLPGARFDLYRVADVSEQVHYTLSGDFKDLPIELNDLDAGGWKAAAETLFAYAAGEGYRPAHSAYSDQQGLVYFGDLSAGLYLAVGQTFETETHIYTPEPMLILLPGNDVDGHWAYDFKVVAKYGKEPRPGSGDTQRKVIKVWKDHSGQARPQEIEVQLLKDGQVYDTVTLNAQNQWTHEWAGLDSTARWQIVESRVPAGYTVSIQQEGTVFIITNTSDAPPPPGDSSKPGLPLTGMLWWPVPLLVCAGLSLVMLGVVCYKREGRNEQ